LAHSDDSQRALTGTPTEAPAETRSETPQSLAPRTVALAFGAAIVFCLLAYLAYAVPGRWFPAASEKAYGATQLTMPRGGAAVRGDELVVSSAAEDGNTVISVTTDFRSAEFPVIAWIVAGFPADARVALLWRTDVEPARVNKRPLEVEAGQAVPADVHRDPHWLGRIVGLALVIQGPIAEPLRVRGVIAKPAGALDTMRDRVREWLAPEPWTGASINTVAGGADVQQLPLPLLLAAAIALASCALWLLLRKRGGSAASTAAPAAIILALIAWFVMDARWTVNLVRQAHATAVRYAGKDARAKHLAGEDRDLYAFIDKARTVLPHVPARIFVMADADFFRGRAAYHLYPHNVWYEPYRNAVPPAGSVHAGDWLVVYQRRGVQYDAARHTLRWDGDVTVAAELKLLEHGGALFVVK
jgi:hypothetical protein